MHMSIRHIHTSKRHVDTRVAYVIFIRAVVIDLSNSHHVAYDVSDLSNSQIVDHDRSRQRHRGTVT